MKIKFFLLISCFILASSINAYYSYAETEQDSQVQSPLEQLESFLSMVNDHEAAIIEQIKLLEEDQEQLLKKLEIEENPEIRHFIKKSIKSNNKVKNKFEANLKSISESKKKIEEKIKILSNINSVQE